MLVFCKKNVEGGRMLTRKLFTKVLHGDHSFTSTVGAAYYMVIIALHQTNWHTSSMADHVAKELDEHWILYSIYPMHFTTVVKKVFDLTKKFSLLVHYQKNKHGKIF